jgi:histidinol-phosphate/aromatic aminotransferase/cobyric acid decarboxylase-like protein
MNAMMLAMESLSDALVRVRQPWHLSGLFAASVASGRYRASYVDGAMTMTPTRVRS